jgi:histone H2A
LLCGERSRFSRPQSSIKSTFSAMATPSKKSSGKKGARSGAQSQSKRAGLIFPVGRIASQLRKGRYAARVSSSAAVYLAAVLEYTVAEILELSAKAVVQAGKTKRITPRALTLAIRHDADLGTLLKDVTLSRGGVVAKAEKALEAKKQKRAGKKKASSATPKV